MLFMDLAKKRYSVRKYKTDKIEPEKIDLILEAGRIAPTAANKQPQRIIVVKDERGLEKIANAANIFKAPLAFIICSDKNDVWVRHYYDNKNSLDIDASIVTTHMMLEATDIGLGSLWVCHFNPDVLREEFDIPENWEPINILAVGYADGDSKSADRFDTERKKLSETVFYEEV